VQWVTIAGSSVGPIDNAASSIVGYILSYGPLGIVVLAFAFRFIVPRGTVDEARKEARTDLIAERDRLLEEKRDAEDQRDEALKVAREQVIPLLINFTSATQSLLPLLQGLITQHERNPPHPLSRRGGPDS
jgi:hypothetical protein